MKTIKWILGMAVALFLFGACTEDNQLGDPIKLEPPYPLPEKGNSEAEDRVYDFFYKYTTYLLYDYTPSDFSMGKSLDGITYESTPGDVQYLGEMLEFLDEVWLDFYPDDFKAKMMPFKVFLANQISFTNKWSGIPTYYTALGRDIDMAIAGMNEELSGTTPDGKMKMKCEINRAFIAYLLNQKDENGNAKLKIPDEFYAVSDYTKYVAFADLNVNPDAARELGYLPTLDNEYIYGSVSEMFGAYNTTRANDIKNYLCNMLMHGDEYPANLGGSDRYTWNYYLQKNEDGSYRFPLVKKKADILQNFFLEEYGLDLRAIGNKSYE